MGTHESIRVRTLIFTRFFVVDVMARRRRNMKSRAGSGKDFSEFLLVIGGVVACVITPVFAVFLHSLYKVRLSTAAVVSPWEASLGWVRLASAYCETHYPRHYALFVVCFVLPSRQRIEYSEVYIHVPARHSYVLLR